MDLHALQIQGFFDFPVDHLHAGPIIADHLIQRGLCGHDVVVVSPDVGGVSMARAFADRIGADFAIVVKRRPGPNKVEVIEVIGDVKDRTCVLVDDMVDTAGSLLSGANALFERGARAACACATHPVLSGNAIERIQASPLLQLVVTDTIPISKERLLPKIEVLSVAPVLAEAIRRIHENASVSTLFRNHGKSG
jgi:ribose-phosphate pyrophosphokinase